jgi:hypothetical protein
MATRTRLSISNILHRRKLHGGLITIRARFLRRRMRNSTATAIRARNFSILDIIDGAQFKSPEEAVEMAAPAMKLTMAIESTNDPDFLPRLIPYMVSEPLGQVLQEPFVASVVPPLLERHRKSIDIIRQRSECKQGTIYFDITDQDLEGYNKFIPYYLHPDSVYSVGLSSSSFRTKVAVGSNPWTKRQNMVNLAKVCERYGGGGHARVGAISFPPDKGDLARAAAAEIVAELRAAELKASNEDH